MFIQAYKQAFITLAKKPFRLWGLSLLSVLISTITTIVTLPFFVAGMAFNYVIQAGMSKIYLDGVEGKEVNSDQLFAGTKRFFRVAGGMAWKNLWSILWSVSTISISIIVFIIIMALFGFIPYAGMILGILVLVACLAGSILVITNRNYAYAFVPYILMTQPDVTATEALRLSAEQTKGKILHMWLADLVCSVSISVVTAILGGIAAVLRVVPFVGGIFAIIYIVFSLALFIFRPIFEGLYRAAFYKMPVAPKVKHVNNAQNFNNGQPQNFQNFNGAPQNFQNFNNGQPQNFQNFNNGQPQNFQNFNGAPQNFNNGAPQNFQNFNNQQ